jgi:hypothetical protein
MKFYRTKPRGGHFGLKSTWSPSHESLERFGGWAKRASGDLQRVYG